MRILLTGGGTGGHLGPLLALVEQIQGTPDELAADALDVSSWNVMYIGSCHGIEVKVMPDTGITCEFIRSGKIRRYFSLRNFLSPFELAAGFVKAWRIIRSFRPHILFSTGGHVSVPVVLAARLARVPIVIHEQTLLPGMANAFAARFARSILLSYPQTVNSFERGKCAVTGNPVRKRIMSGSRPQGRKLLELTGRQPVVLVMGGAQGSHYLNMQILDHLEDWLAVCQLILITGDNPDHGYALDRKNRLSPEARTRFRLFTYVIEELGDFYAASDLVISRSGAGTIAELVALAKPSILVPLPLSAKQEQQKNAELLEKAGGAVIYDETDTGEGGLLTLARPLLTEPEILVSMSKALAPLKQEQAITRIISALAAAAG